MLFHLLQANVRIMMCYIHFTNNSAFLRLFHKVVGAWVFRLLTEMKLVLFEHQNHVNFQLKDAVLVPRKISCHILAANITEDLQRQLRE